MLQPIDWKIVSDVSKDHIAVIFRVKQANKREHYINCAAFIVHFSVALGLSPFLRSKYYIQFYY
jgi:hypothetical protein